MIYRVCDHYNDEDLSNISDICFVCYEFDTTLEIRPMKLSQCLQSKTCTCDGFIHQKCFQQWNNTHKKCPICRTIFIQYDYQNHKSIFSMHTVYIIFQYGKRMAYAIMKTMIYCVLLYSYIEFYIAISTKKHLLHTSHSAYSNQSLF